MANYQKRENFCNLNKDGDETLEVTLVVNNSKPYKVDNLLKQITGICDIIPILCEFGYI